MANGIGLKARVESVCATLAALDVFSLKVRINTEVRDADERFEKLLTARDKRVWESSGDNPFWDFGYPKNAAGELLQDLKAEGLV